MLKADTIRRFRVEATFDLMDVVSLSVAERSAVEVAIEEQKKSTNPKWRVGVAALAENGEIVAVYNPDIGPHHHAEQTAVSEFYRRMPVGQKKLKALAVVGARLGENPVRRTELYEDNVELDQVEPSVWLCGKCLEFIHDCTFNVKDVDILLLTITGQVLKTSLRSLFPKPHTSFTVPLKLERREGGGWAVYPVPSTEEHKENANGNSGISA
jgi:cytidine deaminase